MFIRLLISSFISSLCVFAVANDADPSQSALPSSVDAIKRGATKESFDWLVTETRTHAYELDQMNNGGPWDFMNGQCPEFMNAFKAGKAEYFPPKFRTDDYADARFDPYKEEYRKAYTSQDESVPGSSWFGGGIESRSQTLIRATRNFAVYEMDIDADGVNEVIFYGEMTVNDKWGAPGNDSTASHRGGGFYLIYKLKNGRFEKLDSISISGYYDHIHKKSNENFTSIFIYDGKPYVALSTIFGGNREIKVISLGLGQDLKGKAVYSSAACRFVVK